ncbi:MAG TPA: hypothetical protein VFS88_09865 [Micavibrio sp.]|nr:hypothetical protein [Micavibrio sp.]
MSTLKEKLKEAFDYAQFTAALGVFSVAGVETLQNTLERFGTPAMDISDNPIGISLLAAATGVSVGNSYLQDFKFGNCIPHVVYSTVFGVIAGFASDFSDVASDNVTASPYITAFVAAGAGIALRRNLILEDTTDNGRGRYDDFDY